MNTWWKVKSSLLLLVSVIVIIILMPLNIRADSGDIYYADDIVVSSDFSWFELCSLLSPVCRNAIQDGCNAFAFPVEEERVQEVSELLFTEITNYDNNGYLFDLMMQDYPKISADYTGLTGIYEYSNGYMIVPLASHEESTIQLSVSLWSNDLCLGEYVSISSALTAAIDNGCKNPVLKMLSNGFYCFPAGELTSGFDSLKLQPEDGNSKITIITWGNEFIDCNMTLNYCYLCPVMPTMLNIGCHTITLEGIDTLGIINIGFGNIDTGTGDLFSLVGESGSSLVMSNASQCDFTGNLNIDTLELQDHCYFFSVRGGNTEVEINKLICNSDHTTFYNGSNAASDSVSTYIHRLSIKNGNYLKFSLPNGNQSITIETIDETTGQMDFNYSTLTGMMGNDDIFSLNEISILSEFIPRGNLLSFSIAGLEYLSSAEEVRDWIPKGTRLLKIPYLDPSTSRITLNVDIWDEEMDLQEHRQFSYEVVMDKDGYVYRGDDMSSMWIGYYMIIQNRDSTYSILNVSSDLSGDLIFPETLGGIQVTGTITDYQYYYNKNYLNPGSTKIGAWQSGKVVFPASYQKIGHFTFSGFSEAIFLGPKPVFDDETIIYGSTTIYYLPEYADSWAPDGETEWNGMALVPYDMENHEHIFVDIESIPATCEANGLTAGVRCAVCGEIQSGFEEIPALGHDWGDIVYLWSNDYCFVTAAHLCKNNKSHHLDIETVNTERFVIQSPTYNEIGETDHIAVFKTEGLETQIITVQDIPPLKKMSLLILPEDLIRIEDEAFSGTTCQGIIIPDGCRYIGSKIVAGCENLIYISIPASVEYIEEDAFDDCSRVRIDYR